METSTLKEKLETFSDHDLVSAFAEAEKRSMSYAMGIIQEVLERRDSSLFTDSDFYLYCDIMDRLRLTHPTPPPTTPPAMESPVKFKYTKSESNGGGEFSFEQLLNRANQAESDLAHQTKMYKFMRRTFVNAVCSALALGALVGVSVMSILWAVVK
jgi:hypothetical protein